MQYGQATARETEPGTIRTTAPPNQREGGIQRESQRMERVLEEVHGRLGLLEERLSLVMFTSQPDNPVDGNGAAGRPMSSPATERLISHVIGVQAVAERLDRILSRLDL